MSPVARFSMSLDSLVRSQVLEWVRKDSAAAWRVGPLCVGNASCCSWRLRSLGSMPVCLVHALMRSHSSRASLSDHLPGPWPVGTDPHRHLLSLATRGMPQAPFKGPSASRALRFDHQDQRVTHRLVLTAGTCPECPYLRDRERHPSDPTTPISSNNTTPISKNTSHNTLSRHPEL
jgi:hypothetical protein